METGNDNYDGEDSEGEWAKPICKDHSHTKLINRCNSHDRTIVHFDIDCFYAQVEMIRNPDLRNQALGIQQKNIVVTCNYIAREKGVSKLMYLTDAKRKCPDLVLISGEDLTNYRNMSYQISEYLQKYSPTVERLGFDENFVDTSAIVQHRLDTNDFNHSFSGHLYNNKETSDAPCTCGCQLRLQIGSQIAEDIRKALYKELGITCCAGVAHNKVLAKLVGSQHKPNQQTTLLPHLALCLVTSLPAARSIPGIGSKSSRLLASLGVSLVRDLQAADLGVLTRDFGKPIAETMKKLSLGVDDSPVNTFTLPQSLSDEDSFKCCNRSIDAKNRISDILASLLQRVVEDGRIPGTIRLTLRRVKSNKESRQCPAPKGIFSKCQKMGDHEMACQDLMPTLVDLFNKMVDDTLPFHLTLINICFANFKDTVSSSGTIESFFINTRGTQETENKNTCSKRERSAISTPVLNKDLFAKQVFNPSQSRLERQSISEIILSDNNSVLKGFSKPVLIRPSPETGKQQRLDKSILISNKICPNPTSIQFNNPIQTGSQLQSYPVEQSVTSVQMPLLSNVKHPKIFPADQVRHSLLETPISSSTNKYPQCPPFPGAVYQDSLSQSAAETSQFSHQSTSQTPQSCFHQNMAQKSQSSHHPNTGQTTQSSSNQTSAQTTQSSHHPIQETPQASLQELLPPEMDAATILELPRDMREAVLADHGIRVERSAKGDRFVAMSTEVITRSRGDRKRRLSKEEGNCIDKRSTFVDNVPTKLTRTKRDLDDFCKLKKLSVSGICLKKSKQEGVKTNSNSDVCYSKRFEFMKDSSNQSTHFSQHVNHESEKLCDLVSLPVLTDTTNAFQMCEEQQIQLTHASHCDLIEKDNHPNYSNVTNFLLSTQGVSFQNCEQQKESSFSESDFVNSRLVLKRTAYFESVEDDSLDQVHAPETCDLLAKQNNQKSPNNTSDLNRSTDTNAKEKTVFKPNLQANISEDSFHQISDRSVIIINDSQKQSDQTTPPNLFKLSTSPKKRDLSNKSQKCSTLASHFKNNKKFRLPNDIDPDVFSALPSNIRGEIMAHVAMGTNINPPDPGRSRTSDERSDPSFTSPQTSSGQKQTDRTSFVKKSSTSNSKTKEKSQNSMLTYFKKA